MDIAKIAIDNIALKGVAYKIKNRTVTKGMIMLTCTPCILFSGLIRVISCPFQCFFNKDVFCNPFYACLADSKLTMSSDKCIYEAIRNADAIVKSPLNITLTNEEEIEVLKYAASIIRSTPNLQNRYAIANFVESIMLKQTKEVNSTPCSVIKAVLKLSSSSTHKKDKEKDMTRE